jgi:hypothetical protein
VSGSHHTRCSDPAHPQIPRRSTSCSPHDRDTSGIDIYTARSRRRSAGTTAVSRSLLGLDLSGDAPPTILLALRRQPQPILTLTQLSRQSSRAIGNPLLVHVRQVDAKLNLGRPVHARRRIRPPGLPRRKRPYDRSSHPSATATSTELLQRLKLDPLAADWGSWWFRRCARRLRRTTSTGHLGRQPKLLVRRTHTLGVVAAEGARAARSRASAHRRAIAARCDRCSR